MALTLEQAQTPKCPAAEVAVPIFSPHPIDMECRIAGNVLPVGLRGCNGDYAGCSIWKRHKIEKEEKPTAAVAQSFENNRAKHTIDGVERTSQRG